VSFAAIVGVPTGGACEGRGDEIDGCLDREEMELRPGKFATADGYPYSHFVPACTRIDSGGTEVTAARPGRRYVETAALFGARGQVYSICNADWTLTMLEFAETLRDRLSQ
jgi:hypothetical protein